MSGRSRQTNAGDLRLWRVLTEYFNQWGMEVTQADNGADALSLAAAARSGGAPFEFAVVDLKLQDPSGVPLASALSQQCGPELNVVQLTPALWTPDEHEKIETSAYLAKPIRPSDLYDCIVTQTVQNNPAPGQRRAQTTSLGRRRGHILVVDDNEVNRVLAEELLRELNHQCDLAAGGRAAVEQTSARLYDAILMDCQMPDMNGYQATHEIRESERSGRRRTPIIALTAHAFTGEAQKVKAAGMDDFLAKPVTPQVLDAMLQKWMAIASTGRVRSMAMSAPAPSVRPLEVAAGDPANDTDAPRSPDDPAAGEPMLTQVRRSPRLLQTFLRTVPAQVVSLVQAAGADDLSVTRGVAHKLKGSASSIGALRMSKLCEAIQLSADRGETEHLERWARSVSDVMLQLTAELESELRIKQAES